MPLTKVNTNRFPTGWNTFAISNITGLQNALDSKATTSALALKADASALDAKADVSALAAKADKSDTLMYKNSIPDAANLNDYTGTGIFVQSNNSYAISGTNYPAPRAGKLEVVNYNNSAFIYQTYHEYNSSKIYARGYYNSVWSAWAELLTGATAVPTSGSTTISTDIVVGDSNRDCGMFGVYNAAKTQQIWSMGTSYRSSPTGVDFGNLYGLAYKHTNNTTGGTMAGGHQVVFCSNGNPTVALGAGVWSSGNISGYSDIRVKKNLEPVSDALAKVLRLNGYVYDRIDTGERQLGVVAQEVIEEFPELVTGDETALSVAYGNFAGVFIEAFKELTAEVRNLKERIEELEANR